MSHVNRYIFWIAIEIKIWDCDPDNFPPSKQGISLIYDINTLFFHEFSKQIDLNKEKIAEQHAYLLLLKKGGADSQLVEQESLAQLLLQKRQVSVHACYSQPGFTVIKLEKILTDFDIQLS